MQSSILNGTMDMEAAIPIPQVLTIGLRNGSSNVMETNAPTVKVTNALPSITLIILLKISLILISLLSAIGVMPLLTSANPFGKTTYRTLRGSASWYSSQDACPFNKHPACPTASGASLYALEAQGVPYAASWNYPFGTRLRICRADQPGRCTEVVVLDRGPAKRLHRVLDMNRRSFRVLADPRQGLVRVTIEKLP